MTDFRSIAELGAHIAHIAVEQHELEHRALEIGAEHMQKSAKAKFGEYQRDSVNGVPDWEELADSTKEERVRLGFTENDPLKRSGQLMNSTEISVEHPVAHIGTDDPVMEYQEFGTAKIPPRPVFALTAVQEGPAVAKIMAEKVLIGLT